MAEIKKLTNTSQPGWQKTRSFWVANFVLTLSWKTMGEWDFHELFEWKFFPSKLDPGCKLISKNFNFATKCFFVASLSSYWQRFLRSSGATALLGFLPRCSQHSAFDSETPLYLRKTGWTIILYISWSQHLNYNSLYFMVPTPEL